MFGNERAYPSLPCAAGPLAVKAAVWVTVERMHANGWNLINTRPINTLPHVRTRPGAVEFGKAAINSRKSTPLT